jgi:hypothetical protein
MMPGLNLDSSRNAYTVYYTAQAGGSLPYYKGTASMRGYGIGSWFMNLFRRAIPIIAPIAKTAATRFIASTRQNLDQGKPLGEALKQGAVDAGTGALSQGVDVVKKKMRGGGHGRKKRKRTGVHSKHKPVKHVKLSAGHQHGHGPIHKSKTKSKSKSAALLANF